MLATITKAMKNGTVILGVINIFDSKNPRSNKQFWGVKANVIIPLAKMYAKHCPGFSSLQPFVECMIPVTVLRNSFDRNQDSRLSRQGTSATYYDYAIAFAINSSGKVTGVSTMLTTFLGKLLSMMKRSDFRSSYQSICDRNQSLSGFANTIRDKNDFWLTWSHLSCATEHVHLNKFLPPPFSVSMNPRPGPLSSRLNAGRTVYPVSISKSQSLNLILRYTNIVCLVSMKLSNHAKIKI